MDTLSRRELFKKYSYGLVNTDDIDELQNLFDYASGVIVKDEELANRYETAISARNGNTYVKACYRQDNYKEAQREKLKGMYEESNQYYRWLLDDYNIDPLISRTAEDYEILKSINTTDKNGRVLLTDWQEELFIKCYNEALTYWNNVTRTKSFKNEDSYRQFTEVYLLFMAIQRYVTYRMKSQFDVDTFTKFQCKNYFISNGVDYFDSLPLEYQRRLIKLLNDIQRDKGDDKAFDYIKDILQVNNLYIYKYVLTKTQPTKTSKGDLQFYKVPYDEELNTDTNEVYTFESITEDDPYWRASKDEVLYQTFNTLDTKYISVEYIVDMIKNGKALSYFMYLLNDEMISNREAENKSSLRFLDKNISSNPINLYDSLIALYSLFYTYIKNDQFDAEPADSIDSDGDGYRYNTTNERVGMYNPIEVDGKTVTNDPDGGFTEETIAHIGVPNLNPLIVDVYGYKSYNNPDIIKEKINNIKDLIDEENSLEETSTSVINWNNKLKEFLEYDFNLRNFHYSDNFSFKAIEYYYNHPVLVDQGTTEGNVSSGGMAIKSEFLELARYINAVEIYNTEKYQSYNKAKNDFNLYENVLHDNIKESLEYVFNLIIYGYLPLEYLDIHHNFKKLFKKYIAYLIINEDIVINSQVVDPQYTNYYNDRFDIFYNMMIGNALIFKELSDYSHQMYGYDIKYLEDFLLKPYTQEGFGNFIRFINLVQSTFFTDELLKQYRNLNVFLEIFSALRSEVYDKKINSENDITGLTSLISQYSTLKIADFMQILNENESVRVELEKYITECNNRKIYNALRDLWNAKFKSDFNFDIYAQFESYKEYLLNTDEELYNFVTNFGDYNNDNERRTIIEERILDLATSIEKFIKSNNGIVYNSTFNIIFSDIKEYALLLIKVFKAYTLDTIYSGNVLDFNDPLDERVKVFDDFGDNPDDFITDLEFDAPPEYLDLQDDIRKDNGDLDVSYNLLVRNLVRNTLNTDDDHPDTDDKYLKYLKLDFRLLKAEKNDLPYGVTSLTPDEFNEKYGNSVLPSKLGLSTKKYKYVINSYDFYHNNPDVTVNRINLLDISRTVLTQVLSSDNKVINLYSHIVITKQFLDSMNGDYANKDYDTDEIKKYKHYIRVNRILIDLTNYTVYCNSNDNILKDYWPESRDATTKLFKLDYTQVSKTELITPDVIRIGFLQEENDKIYGYVYNENGGFTKMYALPNLYTYNGLTPYIATNELEPITDGYVNVYYDPNICGSIVYDRYVINPLDNIYNDIDQISAEELADINYINLSDYANFSVLTYDDDFFAKYFNNASRKNVDMRKEKEFYIRPGREYSSYIGNPDRLPYNKRVHPMVITVPNQEYIDYLVENNLVNGDYIYSTEDDFNEVLYGNKKVYFKPIETGISGKYTFGDKISKIVDNVEYMVYNATTSVDNLYFTINGNEVKEIELDLDNNYYLYVNYNFDNLYNMYEAMEEDKYSHESHPEEHYTMFPLLTLYLELDNELTQDQLNMINNALNVTNDIDADKTVQSGKYLYKIVGNLKGKGHTSQDTTFARIDEVINLFNKVGCSLEDINNTGYDINHPFTFIEDLIDEIKKYCVYFVVRSEGVSTIYKYSHEYIGSGGVYDIGYGYSFDGNKIAILFEPLRYYNSDAFKDANGESLLIEADGTLDPSNPYYRDPALLSKETLPYYVDIKSDDTTLEPSPFLYKKDKDTDLVAYPVDGDNYLLALHLNYSNYNGNPQGQFKRYDITKHETYNPGSITSLTNYFTSIKYDKINTANNKYQFYYVINNGKPNFELSLEQNGLVGLLFNADTSDNAIVDLKLKSPQTINDNAWLLTLYSSIEKPDTETSLTIEVDDFIDNSNTFGYIAVKNKGITNYNQSPSDSTDPNNSNRPLLSTIAKLSSHLGLKRANSSSTVSTIDDAINLVNDFTKIGRFTNNIYQNSTENKFLINTDDPIVKYGNHDIENTLYDSSGNYKRLMTYNSERYQYESEHPALYKWVSKSSQEIEPEATIVDMTEEAFNAALPEDYFRDSELLYVRCTQSGTDRYYESKKFTMNNINDNEKDKQFFYDWNYIEELENNNRSSGKEFIVKSGFFKRSLSKNLVDCHIVIIKDGTTIFDSHSDDEIDFYNKEYTFTDKEIFEKNKEYDVFIATTIKNTGSSNGNFVCNLILDNKEGLGASNEKIVYDTDVYGNTIAVYSAKIKPTNKSCKLKFHMAGIIIFDTLIEYDFTEEDSNTHELLLVAPGKERGSDELVNNGSIVYFNDDDDYLGDNINESVEYMPYTYITHKFDTSTDAKKHRIVMISSGSPDSFSRKTDFNLYPYKLDDQWLDYSAFNNGYNAKIAYICGQAEKTITNTINDINDNDKELDIKLNNTIKINYDFEKDLWNKEDNLFVLKIGENTISVNYDSYINRAHDSDKLDCNIKNTSNKYINELDLPSSIMIYANNAFYLSKNIKNFTFSPIAVYYGTRLFDSGSVEKVYFKNDALVLPLENTFNSTGDSSCYRDIPSNLIPKITWDIFKDILGGSIFDSYAFCNTNEFKKYAFTIKFPYNTSKINNSCFTASTINQIDFSSCNYIMYTGDSVFFNDDYLNRRYVLDSNNEIVIRDNYPVYEGEYSYDESSSKNTDIFDENGQTINNYKLSDVLAIIFKHGNNVKMNMFDNYVFAGDKWIRTVDMGNGYTAGYQCFGSCYRLLNILAPEMVYFSNFFISRANTNRTRYSKYSSYKIQIDIGTPDSPNYKSFYTYYYEDSDIDKGWRVIIGGLAYNIKGVDGIAWLKGLGTFKYTSNALKYSTERNRYYYKLIPITDDINDETNMIIGYMPENYALSDSYATIEDMTNAGWTQEAIEGSTAYGETVFLVNSDEVYAINGGYRSETIEVNVSSNYSEACKDCYSLINVEFGDKLYSIADEAFLNAGKIKINNNNLYIIKDQNVTDLGELKSYTNNDFSIQNNHIKYIDKYYNTDLFSNNIDTEWKLLARELENDGNIITYYDAMKIHYHGTNEQFKKVRKKINWNLRERSTKYINLSLTSDNRMLRYKPATSLTDFNEANEDFTGNNYFAYTIDDSSIYLDSITAIKKVNDEYVPDNDVTFTIYPMKNYEYYLNEDHNTTKYKLGIMAKRTIENLPDVLRQHYLERTNDDIEVRRNSNEFDWLYDSVGRTERLPNNPYYNDNTDLSYYRKGYNDSSYTTMGDRFYTTDMTSEFGQYYIRDLNFVVLDQHVINKDLNRKFEVNIKSTFNSETNQPNTAFFDTWEYFNPDNVRFYNDDNTGYYCANFDKTHGTNFDTCIFNESSSELINDAINHLNPIFKDNTTIYYNTEGNRTGYNHKRPGISTDVFYRYNSARKYDNDTGTGRNLKSANDSDFAKLLEASDNNEYLTPRLINYGTTFQFGGYTGVGIEMGYTMFGYELPRGRFAAEHPNGISLYNVESTYPTKNYDDNEANYQIDKPNMFLKDIDVTEPSSNEENNNEFYQKVIARYDNNTQYTRHKQFTSIPRGTTNVVIEGETSTENSNKNRFSFIYRIFNVTMNNGDVESYTINGWQEENEDDNYKVFSNQVTVYNEVYYQNNPSADKTFEFNGVTYHLYDIYNDLHNYCTEINGNTVKVGYAGGIREFTIS